MEDRTIGAAAPAEPLVPTAALGLAYCVVEALDGFRVRDSMGAVIDRADTRERAMAIALALAATAGSDVVEPYAC